MLEQLFVSDAAREFRSRAPARDKEKFDAAKADVMDGRFWADIKYMVHIFNEPGIFLRMGDGYKTPVIK